MSSQPGAADRHDHGRNPQGFVATMAAMIAVLFVGFCVAVEYGEEANGGGFFNNDSEVSLMYGMYQDVTIMMVIGFGFLMVFLRKNGYTSSGLNFLLCAVVMLWSILAVGLIEHWYHGNGGKVAVGVSTLVLGQFAVATVLISYGAVLGKVTAAQLVWMAVFEIVFYAINERILIDDLKMADVGGSAVIHAFGAYFGLAVSYMVSSPAAAKSPAKAFNSATGTSDMFAMIGTLFLWAFWPSFTSAFAHGSRSRTIINTLLALCGSCVSAFFGSHLLRGGRFDMVDVQNATLAGGVAIGTVANFMLEPWGALLVGLVGGAISVYGFARLSDRLTAAAGLQDTCGVHNLHGLPGIFSVLVSVLAVWLIPDDNYGIGVLASVFPGREDRSRGTQGWYQLSGILVTLAMALGSGALTGLVLRQPFFGSLTTFFQDKAFWHVEEHGDEEETAAAGEADPEAAGPDDIPMKQLETSSSSNALQV